MPPRLSLRSFTGRSNSLPRVTATPSPDVCLFCSLKPRTTLPRTRRKPLTTRRNQSTSASNARRVLQDSLQELQKHAANYVNLSRVQLAINALGQEAGDETVRVAILGLTNGSESGRTAKEVLRLLLADPLSAEQEWEKDLLQHDPKRPLIVRIGADRHQDEETNLTYGKGGLLKELNVSCPGLNGHRLEILFMESNPLADSTKGAFQGFEEAALVPTVEIPQSSTGRYTPVTTPVHKALLVTDGLVGAASLLNLPLLSHGQTIAAAVNLPNYHADNASGLPFTTIDVKTAGEGLAALRQSLDRAFEYEKLWFKSNMPAIMTWLKSGTTSIDNGATKDAVRGLISSVLRNALFAIQEEETRGLSAASLNTSSITTTTTYPLHRALLEWAEKAHAELQGELDRAFTSRRWRKLNWWKLFWRVDDVGMLSADMLSQRFLPRAERNVIYLAGQIEGAGLLSSTDGGKAVYSLPVVAAGPEPKRHAQDSSTTKQVSSSRPQGTRWPTHITFTRNYLQSETIPALQALAQSLVLQSASFSTLTTALGALMYLSSFGISESGAVAAFGIVWSLRRLQKKWETAREYWQSEVREEGRKAVRAVEISVGEALDRASTARTQGDEDALLGELNKARELVQKAEEALEKLK